MRKERNTMESEWMEHGPAEATYWTEPRRCAHTTANTRATVVRGEEGARRLSTRLSR